MYYSELVKKACVIMYDAHKEDMDKGGYPYVFHPFIWRPKWTTKNLLAQRCCMM